MGIPTRRIHHFAVAALLSLSPHAYANQCSDRDAIWSATSEGYRYIVYGTDGLDMFSAVTLEQWRNQNLAWRAKGTVSCSSGHVVCQLSVENNLEPLAPGSDTAAVIEKIDDNSDGVTDWLVLAGLQSALWYAGGAKVEWFNGFAPQNDDDRQTAPNVFRLDSCRISAQPAPVRLAPNVILPPMTVGTVYAETSICNAFRQTGGLSSPVVNDGLWWMDDERVEGWEWGCKISSRTSSQLNLDCEGEGTTWKETRKFRAGDGWVEIDGARLERCLK